MASPAVIDHEGSIRQFDYLSLIVHPRDACTGLPSLALVVTVDYASVSGRDNATILRIRLVASASLMQGRAQCGLDRLQNRAAVFPAPSKDTAEELVYFSRHILMESALSFWKR